MAETVTQHPIGSRVRVREDFDPNDGKEGIVEDRAAQPRNPEKYPGTLVMFTEDRSIPNGRRWYRDAHLEAVDEDE